MDERTVPSNVSGVPKYRTYELLGLFLDRLPLSGPVPRPGSWGWD